MPSRLAGLLPVWPGRRQMIRAINALAQQPSVIALCRRHEVGVATWQAVMINDAIDADNTGRGIRTSKDVAALRVQRGDKQVQRARAVGVALGILIPVYGATELGLEERLALVREHPGSKARGRPMGWVMTICPARMRARISTPEPGRYAQVLPNVPLPPVGGPWVPTSRLLKLTLAPADADQEQEPPPAAQRQRRSAPPGVRLAATTMTHPALQGMLPGISPRRCAGQLAPYAAGGWDGRDLAIALYEEAVRRGIPTGRPARSPFGFLKMLLAGVDPVADVHLRRGAGFEPVPAPTCANAACDHGWIEDRQGRVSPCPGCGPEARRWFAQQCVDRTYADPAADGEPPF